MEIYRQATWVGLGCNPGDPPADKDSLKAEHPKITAKPQLGLIESFNRYHGYANTALRPGFYYKGSSETRLNHSTQGSII